MWKNQYNILHQSLSLDVKEMDVSVVEIVTIFSAKGSFEVFPWLGLRRRLRP
jgi:hypothetical protein